VCKAGHQVTILGLQPGKELKGKKGAVRSRAEVGIDQVRPEQFDALFIPGGYSRDHLRADARVVAFTKAIFDSEKPVLAICVDRNLVTSRQPSDIPAFIRESLKRLEKVPVGSR
jgi:protease I